MAGERLRSVPLEQKAEAEAKKPGIVKRGLLWVGEKSTYVTFPIAGVIFLKGAIAGPAGLMALGGAGMAVDVAQNRLFRKWRKSAQGEPEGKEVKQVHSGYPRTRQPALQAA